MYLVAVLTSRDLCAAGLREDRSGPTICELCEAAGYRVVRRTLLPDEQPLLEQELRTVCDGALADLILTTGGTGLAPRDRMPEATAAVAERMVPGIPEAMRLASMQVTDRAMLSRAAAATRGATLIVNLPGSPKAVRECLQAVLPALGHALDMLTGAAGNCAG